MACRKFSDQCKIEKIPTEVLIEIVYRYVEVQMWPILAVLCSWSNFIVKRCWEMSRKIDFGVFPLMRPQGFAKAMKGCVNLESLRVDCTYLKPADLLKITEKAKSIELESVDNIIAKDAFWTNLARFSKLERLKITNLNETTVKINFEKFSEMLSSTMIKDLQIHRVHLSDNRTLILPEGLEKLKICNMISVVFPSTLTHLHIRNTNNKPGQLGLNQLTLNSLPLNCPNLLALTIIDYSISDDITDQVFQKLIRFYSNLYKLKLSKFSQRSIHYITDITLMQFSQYCRNLSILSLDSFPKITDAGVIELLNSYVGLRKLSLNYSYITDDSLQAIGNLELTSLALKNCSRITSLGLADCLGRLSHLEKLNLSYAHGVTDEVLSMLELSSPNLQELSLSISDYDLSLNSISSLSNLKLFTFNSKLTTNFSILCNFTQISALSLSGCTNLQDSDVEKFTLFLPLIKKLNLANCPHLTDLSFEHTCRNLRNLKYFNMVGVKLSTNIFKYLPLVWKNLKYLKISKLSINSQELEYQNFVEKFKVLVSQDGHTSIVKFKLNK